MILLHFQASNGEITASHAVGLVEISLVGYF